jgi:opacity protein-like surface antigen
MTKTFWTLLVFSALACSTSAWGQPFGAGIKLGTTLTDALASAHSGFTLPGSNHLIVGPYVEVRLPAGFSVEADALYESAIFNSVYTGGSTWQFPVVAKYKLLTGPVRPYVEGGVSFSHITDLAEIPALSHSSNFGIVLGAGLEVKLLVLRISPEIRYNGWTLQSIQDPAGFFHSNRNQAMFQVGFGF